MTSSAIDYKKDGFISGIGSNTFKLAGSVILYGTISAFILTIIKVIING
jgi:stage V sporulation protein AC